MQEEILEHYPLDCELAARLSEKQAKKFKAIILGEERNKLVVGMVNPENLLMVDELSRILKRPLSLVSISEETFDYRLVQTYSQKNSLVSYANKLADELNSVSSIRDEFSRSEEPAVMQMLMALFEDALKLGASDIHIEPAENLLRIRLRVDGLLQEEIIPLSGKLGIIAALTQRLKLMARLNISEKRLPQDGRFDLEIRGVRFSVRLSTMPIRWGESVVMRILRKGSRALDLSYSGMSKKVLEAFRRLIRSPNGIVLVTGPTGSGKTTTLYGALSEISDVSKNIITIEDPIEYELERANQVQVNTSIGLTFAETLRCVLRQDPDVIFIGEIRDRETAEIALRSALTGHIVFSTLHTNDAAGVAERLIDMGLEPYLVAAALRGAVAQRLVRCVCTKCAKDYQPSESERIFFEGVLGAEFKEYIYVKGTGCKYCHGSGYHGMTGVYELLVLDDELRAALKAGGRVFNDAIKVHPNRSSTLLQSAFDLAKQKLIPLDEVVKIAGA